MKLSIVTTLYQSAPYIEEFCSRAARAAHQIAGEDYEIVLVNDGSPDNSLELAVRLSKLEPHVIVVDLSRNFGHHKAMMTGLAYSRGDHVFLIDSDLEEEPEWLLSFAEQMAEKGCDVIYGVQARRKGRVIERWSGRLFYSMFRAFTRVPLPDNIAVARFMTRRYVDALLLHDEREVFMAGLWTITGFDQRPVTITKHSTSRTTYTFARKMSQLVNSVTSFSNAPLIGIFYVGAAVSVVAGAYATYIVFHWLFLASPPDGWTSLIASVWLLGGLVILFIGVVGIYLSKVFSETKRRPYTIVRQVYGKRTEEK